MSLKVVAKEHSCTQQFCRLKVNTINIFNVTAKNAQQEIWKAKIEDFFKFGFNYFKIRGFAFFWGTWLHFHFIWLTVHIFKKTTYRCAYTKFHRVFSRTFKSTHICWECQTRKQGNKINSCHLVSSIILILHWSHIVIFSYTFRYCNMQSLHRFIYQNHIL